MPRKRRTQSGAPAQSIGSVPGQRYGEGVAQQQMQAMLPAPDNRAIAARPAGPGGGGGGGGESVAAPRSMADVLAEMGGIAGEGMLSAPPSNPNAPITSGLSVGPGPGREALGGMSGQTPGGRFLRDLAQRTGNPYFAQLAEKSGQ